MKTCASPPDRLNEQTDLPTVLAAWHQATVRLEQTHETLRDEVQRLTQELEIKNRELRARTVWPIWARSRRTWLMRCATVWCRSRFT